VVVVEMTITMTAMKICRMLIRALLLVAVRGAGVVIVCGQEGGVVDAWEAAFVQLPRTAAAPLACMRT
jgi:hypothetical protein